MKLTFTIAENGSALQTHQLIGLCDYLSATVLEPMFRWDRRFMNFLSCDDSSDPLEPTGNLRLKVPRLFLGQVGELESRIEKQLDALKIKAAPIVQEWNAAGNNCELVISITQNPTAMVIPPEVNMSQTRGCLVLRDLLGYQKLNGRYEFAADELLQRAASITEDKIAACTASPIWDPKTSATLARKPSTVSMRAVKRCLDEIQNFAQWAMSHNYRKLAAI